MNPDGGKEADFKSFRKLMEQKILSSNPAAEMRDAYGAFDEGGKGKINAEDLIRVAEQCGDTLTLEDATALIKSVTKGKSDEIDFEDFLQAMKNQKLCP